MRLNAYRENRCMDWSTGCVVFLSVFHRSSDPVVVLEYWSRNRVSCTKMYAYFYGTSTVLRLHLNSCTTISCTCTSCTGSKVALCLSLESYCRGTSHTPTRLLSTNVPGCYRMTQLESEWRYFSWHVIRLCGTYENISMNTHWLF